MPTHLPQPGPVTRVSPTFAVEMAQCMLRAAYRLDPATSVPRGPRAAAILGTTAHRLAEEAAMGGFLGPADYVAGEVARRWDEVIEGEAVRLSAYQWLGAVPAPTRWRNYERTRTRVINLVVSQLRKRGAAQTEPSVQVEKRLSSDDPPLVGQIDRIEAASGKITIVDVKSSAPTAELSEPYRLQLLLYAALLRAAEGVAATDLAIQYLDGTRTTVGVQWDEVSAAVDEVLGRRDEIMTATARGLPIPASPSGMTCRFCPFKLVCPAFERDLDTETKQSLGVVLGHVVDVSPNGTSAFIDADGRPPMRLISPPVVSAAQRGDAVAVSGAVVAASGLDVRTTWESTAIVWRRDQPGMSFPRRLERPGADTYIGELEGAAETLETA